MDCEKLIELVSTRECLYNMDHKKYCDHHYKERIWIEISKELQEPAQICKKTWANLRDVYRRAMKKYITRSGSSLSNAKKWKYEVEMSFLKPHMKSRDTLNSVYLLNDDKHNISDEEEEEFSAHFQNVDESDPLSDSTDRQDNFDAPSTSKRSSRIVEGDESVIKKHAIKRSELVSSSKSASSTEKKFILNNREDKSKATEVHGPSAIDQFFSTMSTTVKTFTPHYQHLAKTRVFSIISELEFEQLPP